MPDMDLWSTVAREIAAASGAPFAISARHGAGGGCINQAYVVEGGGWRYFVKTNRADRLPMFEAEADGLAELAQVGAIRVPRPVCSGSAGGSAFLVLEHIEFGGGGRGGAERLGAQLAALHRNGAERFGWKRDNTIGATPQNNDWNDSWVEFWRERRLGYQLALAVKNGAGGKLLHEGEKLFDRLPEFFKDYRPVPSLLHGDLWGGNAAYDESGAPVIFDPAVYYGDREADLAMTELFGGFPPAFHAAYREAWPLPPGYAVRKTLYNLYHVLNHYNLFGDGYLGQAERMIASLLAEMK